MQNKRLLTAITGTFIILWISLTPLPEGTHPPGETDKIIHFFLYFLLFFLWKRTGYISKNKLCFFLTSLGGIIEILQEILPIHRSFDWWDWAADIGGILLGYVFL